MEEKFRKRYYLIFFSSILGPITTNSLVPIFEELRIHFGLDSIALISLAISFYILPFAIFQLFAGTFSDIINKKTVVVLGCIIFIVGLFLTIIAIIIRNFNLFLIAFSIQGIGFSFINPTILAIISILSPERKKGMIMGIYNSSAGIGVSMGAFLAGLFANYFLMWELLFFLNPIIAILALIFILIALRDCEAIVCKTSELDSKNLIKKSKITATFLQLKNNLKPPIILLGLVGFICFFIVITLVSTLNEQMRTSLADLSDQEIIYLVSLILTINGLISVVLSPLIGLLLRKINSFITLGIGFMLTFIMFLMPLASSINEFMIISFITYIGSAFIWTSLFEISMDINPDAKGTNSAIVNSFRFIGYSLVGPFYLYFGIPIIYFWVIGFNFLAVFIIFVLIKIT